MANKLERPNLAISSFKKAKFLRNEKRPNKNLMIFKKKFKSKNENKNFIKCYMFCSDFFKKRLQFLSTFKVAKSFFLANHLKRSN